MGDEGLISPRSHTSETGLIHQTLRPRWNQIIHPLRDTRRLTYASIQAVVISLTCNQPILTDNKILKPALKPHGKRHLAR